MVEVDKQILELMDELWDNDFCPTQIVELLNSDKYAIVHTTKDGELDIRCKDTLEQVKADLEEGEEDSWELYGVFYKGKMLKTDVKTVVKVSIDG